MNRILPVLPYKMLGAKDMNYVDRIVRENSAFTGMTQMVEAAEHGYRPTVHVDCEEKWYIAEIYDATMKHLGKEQRAFRPRTDNWEPSLLNRVKIEVASTIVIQKYHVCKNASHIPFSRAGAYVANYEITVNDEQGNMRERDYPERLTLKGIKQFVAYQEQVPVDQVMDIEWKHTYSVGGRVECEAYKGQHNIDNDRWEEDWWGAEEYFDIPITKDDLIIRRNR